jgi:hypothetical protein
MPSPGTGGTDARSRGATPVRLPDLGVDAHRSVATSCSKVLRVRGLA